MMPQRRRDEDLVLRALMLCADRELIARLRETLFAVGGVELLASAATAAELLALGAQLLPDVVLLDTDRLGGETDAVLRAWQAQSRATALVAVTARPDLAPAGLATLARPLSADATRGLVARLRAEAESDGGAHRRPAVPEHEKAGPYVRRLLVRSPGHVRLLPVEEILWIDAVHNAVKLHSQQGEFRLRQSVVALLGQLDPQRFVRIHRSTVVQLDAVREFRVNPRGQYSAVMPGGARLTVSRSYHDALLARLQQA